MKIEQKKVETIRIDDIYQSHGLDPITVFLEDYEPRKGKITINCYDKSWNSFWGGMGDRTIAEFFVSCDNHYLAKNLSGVSSTVDDYEELSRLIKEFYGEDIDFEVEDELRELSGCQNDGHNWVNNNAKIMEEVFGCDWYYDIPTMENPKYKYLNRIIDTVREALQIVINESKS